MAIEGVDLFHPSGVSAMPHFALIKHCGHSAWYSACADQWHSHNNMSFKGFSRHSTCKQPRRQITLYAQKNMAQGKILAHVTFATVMRPRKIKRCSDLVGNARGLSDVRYFQETDTHYFTGSAV